MKLGESLRTKILTDVFNTATTMDDFAVTLYGHATNPASALVPATPALIATDGGTSTIKLITLALTNGTVGMNWDIPALGSVVRLAPSAASGYTIAAGHPKFFRIHKLSEDSTVANTAYYRIQGLCGQTAYNSDGTLNDAILDSTFFPMAYTAPSTNSYPLGNVVLTIPEEI